jgi:hypothetical protein
MNRHRSRQRNSDSSSSVADQSSAFSSLSCLQEVDKMGSDIEDTKVLSFLILM